MGQQMVGWNLPRTTGRVWAYLLMQHRQARKPAGPLHAIVSMDAKGARAASTPTTRARLSDMASGIQEILERESAALAGSRKGKRS